MEKTGTSRKKPSPKRLEALKYMPKELLQTLTKEEVDAFLYDDAWPDSLQEKLKDFISD